MIKELKLFKQFIANVQTHFRSVLWLQVESIPKHKMKRASSSFSDIIQDAKYSK